MLEKFKVFLRSELQLSDNEKILLAVSGGPDSICMLHLFAHTDHTIGIAHINHDLRAEESMNEEQFVRSIAADFNLPFFCTHLDLKNVKSNLQERARIERYAYLQKIAIEENYDFIGTAHHMDDEIENFIFRISRGSGIQGLNGIPARRNNVIRPLLFATKRDILLYNLENKLEFKEDSSNLISKYKRNLIRNEILPYLESKLPGFHKGLETTISNLKESSAFLNDQIDNYLEELKTEYSDHIVLDLKKLLEKEQRNFILYSILSSFGFNKTQTLTILYAQKGSEIKSHQYRIIKGKEELIVLPLSTNLAFSELIIKDINKLHKINKGVYLDIRDDNPEYEPDGKMSIMVDTDKITFPLLIRKKQDGDWFCPYGMKMKKKKLKKYFSDEKLNTLEKEKVRLLCTADNKIIWILGYRQDERFKVKKKSQNKLLLRLFIE